MFSEFSSTSSPLGTTHFYDHIYCHLPSCQPVNLISLIIRGPEFHDARCIPVSCYAHANSPSAWTPRDSQTYVQAIMRWLFVITSTSYAIWTLLCWSSPGFTATVTAFQCCYALVLRRNVDLLSVKKNFSMKENYGRLYNNSMGKDFTKIVGGVLTCVFRSVTYISLSDSIVGHVTATFNFVFQCTRGYSGTALRQAVCHPSLASIKSLCGDPFWLQELQDLAYSVYLRHWI